mgnify:CR=1 FL=1
MKILVIKIDLRAPYVHSLKEKRMIVKSIIGKLQNKFNISIREVENQDLHQRISIGMVKLDLNSKDSDKAKEKIIDFDRNNITILDIDKLEEILFHWKNENKLCNKCYIFYFNYRVLYSIYFEN